MLRRFRPAAASCGMRVSSPQRGASAPAIGELRAVTGAVTVKRADIIAQAFAGDSVYRDDVIETLLLNVLFSGQIKAMAPRLRSDDGRNVVIRPLIYCDEADLGAFAQEQRFPVVPVSACGSQESLQRQRIKRLIRELAAEDRNVPGNLFAALGNVLPSHLLDLELRARLGID